MQKQLGGIFSAPQAIVSPDSGAAEKDIPVIEIGSKSVRKRGPRNKSTSGDKVGIVALDFRHDPEKWGSPTQSWKTLDKAIWLILVAENQASAGEMSGSLITATFNKHFRQAGEIKLGNVNRDLGVAKGKTPSIVGEDTSKSPSVWYLTETGKMAATALAKKTTSGASAAL